MSSPKSVLLELEDFSTDPANCCSACRSAHGNSSIPPDCTGVRGRWLATQIFRTVSWLSSQQLPFVLKFQQSFGGGGIFIITSPDELSELELTLSTLILPKLLSRINASNAHLKPATLVVSEMIRDPIGNWGLTFFLTRAGKCIFLAVSQQILDSGKSWVGSTISYIAQENLKQKFTPIMQEIGSWLHGYGYFGPCGADILETAGSADGCCSSNTLKIVDLNVRISGSLLLGLLKGHFSGRRQLHEATTFSITVRMSRTSFIRTFDDSIEQGRMIITSWYEDLDSGLSYGSLVVGARDRQTLERDVVTVKEVASEIKL